MSKKEKVFSLNIKGISLHQESQLPVIILQSDDGKQTLPITIGPFEASAIITELEDIHPPRPLTHDLFSQMLSKHKFKLTSLYIYKNVQEKYFSKLYYKRHLRTYSMEVRPSDGIALIIRHGGTIETNRDVLENKADDFWVYDVDQMSDDFLFLKNNSNDHTFM